MANRNHPIPRRANAGQRRHESPIGTFLPVPVSGGERYTNSIPSVYIIEARDVGHGVGEFLRPGRWVAVVRVLPSPSTSGLLKKSPWAGLGREMAGAMVS